MEDDDDDEDGDGLKDAAVRALAMAKDMVLEAINVQMPTTESGTHPEPLQIRVGIHVGDVTCGVLGQRLPKFTTCGKGKGWSGGVLRRFRGPRFISF